MSDARFSLKMVLALSLALLIGGCASQRQPAAPASDHLFDVRALGAAGDGSTDDSDAIAHAITACQRAGGGVVRFSAGTYLTGPVRFVSHMTMQLDRGAKLLFLTDPQRYPLTLVRWEGTECYNFSPLICGRDLTEIAIRGEGTIDGQGDAWYPMARHQADASDRLRAMNEQLVPVEDRKFGTVQDGLRPALIEFWNCSNLRLEGVTIQNSPFWTVHPVYCRGVFASNLTIHGRGPNTDGFDPDSCSNVTIDHCDFDTGDDCIAIKSGRDVDGRRVNRPSENIVVSNCTMRSGHAAVALGSEVSGGIRDVIMRDCTIDGTDRAFYIKTMRGRGSAVQNIRVEGLRVRNVKNEVLAINMAYNKTDPEPVSDRTPGVNDVSISNVTGAGRNIAIHFVGLPERSVGRVVLQNITIVSPIGFQKAYADNVHLSNVHVHEPAEQSD